MNTVSDASRSKLKPPAGRTRITQSRKPVSENAKMTEAVLEQFVEGENWDNKAWVWRHFRELRTLPRAIRVRLQEMMKLQEKLHKFIHHCDHQHMEYCTSEAIPYELYACLALLAWEDGEAEATDVERRLCACSAFYRWAMMPAKRRPDRSLEGRAMNRVCRRGTWAVLAAIQERAGTRLGKRSRAVRVELMRSSQRVRGSS